jgi:hypothetical protein
VELLLNFLWLSLSLLLVVTWVRAAKHGHTKSTWTTLIALGLLLVLLLPVISMTDDLVAMENPSEIEHVVRRSEMPLLHLAQDTAALLDSGVLAVLLMIGFAFLFSRLSRFSLRVCPRKLTDGFICITGVRPPPMAVLSA